MKVYNFVEGFVGLAALSVIIVGLPVCAVLTVLVLLSV